MKTLIIRHIDQCEPVQFQVVRLPDGKSVGPTTVPAPVGFPVKDRPNSDLMRELRWYLETFLDYPFSPETDHAERVRDALKAWGEQAFAALFGNRATGRLLGAATNEQYADFQLQISSDDPGVLSWPWEALRDPEAGVLSRTCQVERRLNKLRDPHPISEKLPRDRVNILLVTARPFKADVRYRSISRALVDQVERLKLPATVTILRPPTFAQLRAHLHERPDHYHILHFDGHGSYGQRAAPDHPHALALKGLQGQLVFEDDDGRPDPQTAEVLSELLRDTRVPVVVLNACQSAMVDDRADDAFASVAAGLLRSGVRSVVAMAYSLYVSGAQQFLPAFYRQLFASGNVADATRAGRQQMLAQPMRICARGRYPLDDWLVPVVYEQDPLDVSFVHKAPAKETVQGPALPQEAEDSENPYGFIGRDAALLALERALRRPPAGILIHGLGGVGKTTLCRGLLQWLAATDGLGKGCFWFSFQGVRSAEFVFNEMVGALFGTNALADRLDEKIRALVGVFREQRFLIAWDNFEVVCGIPGTALQPTLSAEARSRLLQFLRDLRGGASKVLITSRSEEEWLDPTACFKLGIGGLAGEERWEYCDTIVRDLGLAVDRTDPDWVKLMDFLCGHPLMMRVVLPKLQKTAPGPLMKSIESNLEAFAAEDPESAKLFATLEFSRDGLPQDLQPLLAPVALHEQFVVSVILLEMARQVDPAAERGAIDRLMSALHSAGLLRERGNGIHEMHPALGRFLRLAVLGRAGVKPRDAWCRAFVVVMAAIADHYAPKQLHEQRPTFHFLGANFGTALVEARRLGIDLAIAALTQALGTYAQNERDFEGAVDLFARLAEHHGSEGGQGWRATAYHHLGMIAQERRDFSAAEQWYRKSLASREKQRDEHGMADTYHQLGTITQEQRDFTAAERWYSKSLPLFEKQGKEYGVAGGYHELGMIADEQRDFAAAEQWFRRSLAISERSGDEYGAAKTYHHLGMIAHEQRDFPAAEQWYRKSLAIKEQQGDEHAAASTYHQLGITAQEQRDFAVAERWYRKSLAIKENEGDEHGAATTYHQLGKLAALDGQHEQAGQWFIKAHERFRRSDPHSSTFSAKGFLISYQRVDESTRGKLKAMWEEAGLGELPEA